MSESYEIRQDDPDQAPIVVIVACEFGPGHDWIDITTLSDVEERAICRICEARGRRPFQPRSFR